MFENLKDIPNEFSKYVNWNSNTSPEILIDLHTICDKLENDELYKNTLEKSFKYIKLNYFIKI